MRKYLLFMLFIAGSLLTANSFAQSAGRANLNNQEGRVVYSTNLDFDSTMIDGRHKAPMGFFLQGRNKQSLSNMVKLRSNFKRQLNQSRTAVKAMVR